MKRTNVYIHTQQSYIYACQVMQLSINSIQYISIYTVTAWDAIISVFARIKTIEKHIALEALIK